MKKIYRGWWIALTCMLLMAFAFAPGMNLTGVFVKPIAEDFNISRTMVTTQITIQTIASLIITVFVGQILKRVNIKGMMSVGTAVVALCYILRAFCTNIYQLYICAAVNGAVVVLVASIPVSILVNNWFGSKIRGKVMGIVMAGTGIGATVLNPIFGYINDSFGWRYSYGLIGIVVLVLLLPLVIITVEKSPEALGLTRLGDAEDALASGDYSGLTLKRALRSRMFWFLCIVFFMFALAGSLFTANNVAFLSDIGFTAVEAASMAAIASAALILAKIALGVSCDRFGVKQSAIWVTFLVAAGGGLLVLSSQFSLFALPGVILYSMGTAVPTVTMPLITEELFGNKEYGSIYSLLTAFSTIGLGVGPILGTLIFDTTQSYSFAWSLMLVLAVTMAAFIWLAYTAKKRLLAQEED